MDKLLRIITDGLTNTVTVDFMSSYHLCFELVSSIIGSICTLIGHYSLVRQYLNLQNDSLMFHQESKETFH